MPMLISPTHAHECQGCTQYYSGCDKDCVTNPEKYETVYPGKTYADGGGQVEAMVAGYCKMCLENEGLSVLS